MTYSLLRYILKIVNFEWDESKNLFNQIKHGLSFEEASELFTSGRDYLELYDEAHSTNEDRYMAIGLISRGVTVVLLTERDDDESIRIISARWATTREQHLFNKYMDHRNV